MDERRQFRVLYRGFLLRFIDLEMLAAGGAMHNLLTNVAALLGAFSFVLALLKVPQYYFATDKFTNAQLAVAAWEDQKFVLSTTIMVAGLFTVLLWDALFPDRRDCLVLGPLPIRMRTLFAAKLAATGAALGLAAAAVNIFTGLSYPFLMAAAPGGIIEIGRGFAAYWLTAGLAALFVFSSLISLQGVLLHSLSHARFQRISAYVQLGAFFLLVGTYFLTPPYAHPRALAAPENQIWLQLIPSFWFLGLYQHINGTAPPVFDWLAVRALAATAIAAGIAALMYLLAYGRQMRRIVEQAGAIPTDRRRAPSPVSLLAARLLFGKPVHQAVFLFTARTLARSQPHRMLLAIYGGIGLSVGLAYLREMLYGRAQWTKPDTPLLAFGVVQLFFVLTGMRFAFSLPVDVRANWIFRLTEGGSIGNYRGAVRRTLLVLVPIPLWLASAIIYPSLWPWKPAIAHLLLLAFFSTLLVERALAGFRKLPFTCSYLPGSANLKVKLGVYAILILSLADFGVRIELLSFGSARGFTILCGLMLAGILWTRRQSRLATLPPNDRLMFDEAPAAEVSPLNLHADAPLYSRPLT